MVFYFSGSLTMTSPDGVRMRSRIKAVDATAASADMKYSPPAAPLSASSAVADSSSLVGPGFEVIAPPPNYHQAVDVDTGDLCRQDSKEPPPTSTTAAAAVAAVVQRDFEFKEVAITATKAEQLNDRDVGGYHSIHLSQLLAYHATFLELL